MKLLKCYATNFGSHKSLEFSLSSRGLTLIHGITGSGKSTILDIICWGLFGETPKGLSADGIKSWKYPNETTSVTISLEINDQKLIIRRDRGPNDLLIMEESGTTRGKDLNDTQGIINTRLGLNYDLFVASSYFHEFNPVGAFFVSKAKDRRAMFENLADLSFPAKLSTVTADAKKHISDSIRIQETNLVRHTARIEQLELRLKSESKNLKQWQDAHEANLFSLLLLDDSFEYDKQKKIVSLNRLSDEFLRKKAYHEHTLKAGTQFFQDKVKLDSFFTKKIEELTNKSSSCETCGQSLKTNKIQDLEKKRSENQKMIQERDYMSEKLSRVEAEVNPHTEQIQIVEQQENQHKVQYELIHKKINPFIKSQAAVTEEFNKEQIDCENTKRALKENKERLFLVKTLSDLAPLVRAELIGRTISSIQELCNNYLEKYFNSEFRVAFSTTDSDDIDVEILKSGYNCNYKQLSKGQRKLLSLCFTVSTMKIAANSINNNLNVIFMDEPTDGFDTELKLKSFNLFQELSEYRESVFIIEHSPELKNLFDNNILVEMENDESHCIES